MMINSLDTSFKRMSINDGNYTCEEMKSNPKTISLALDNGSNITRLLRQLLSCPKTQLATRSQWGG